MPKAVDYGYNTPPGWPNFTNDENDPVLVLATTQIDLRPKNPDEWAVLSHQVGGIGCHEVRLLARKLQIRPEHHDGLRKISAHYLCSNLGVFGLSLDDYIVYDALLRQSFGDTVRARSPVSLAMLEEAIYPIDWSPEAARLLCSDDLPDQPDALMDFDKDWKIQKFMGCLNRWSLYLLGPNSD